MKKTDNKDIYYLMIKQIDFMLYSVLEVIYEEVRTALIKRGLALIYVFKYRDLPRVMYTSFKNLKIDIMRNYYANKHKYNNCMFNDDYMEKQTPDEILDKKDDKELYIVRMEALLTGINRMRPVQQRLVRRFFKEFFLKRDFYGRRTFKVSLSRVIHLTKTNKRRGMLLLQQIRVILNQVIKERNGDSVAIYNSKSRVASFDELWEKIKGDNKICVNVKVVIIYRIV